MRRRLTLAIIAAFAMTAALMPGAIAGAERPEGAAIPLTSLAAIERYLISQGIDPSGAVVQQGALNYAGPDCPGEGWSCTDAKFVIQLASGASFTSNSFQCTVNTCTVVQTLSGGNDARCIQRTSANPATQTCSITQTATTGTNRAVVEQVVEDQPASTQTATQTATVIQTNGSGSNRSLVVQKIKQEQENEGSGPITQVQNGFQKAEVCQAGASDACSTSTPSAGSNSSEVRQSVRQELEAEGGTTIDQNQNNAANAGGHIQARVRQLSTDKKNTSLLTQTNTQQAEAEEASGSVHQTQGLEGSVPSGACSFAGLCGVVFQSSTGVQLSEARQEKVQKLEAEGGTTIDQEQFGPELCCSVQEGGNPANKVKIVQTKKQIANGTTQEAYTQGNCDSSSTDNNNCTVTQTVNQNGTVTTNSPCTGSPCQRFILCDPVCTSGTGTPFDEE